MLDKCNKSVKKKYPPSMEELIDKTTDLIKNEYLKKHKVDISEESNIHRVDLSDLDDVIQKVKEHIDKLSFEKDKNEYDIPTSWSKAGVKKIPEELQARFIAVYKNQRTYLSTMKRIVDQIEELGEKYPKYSEGTKIVLAIKSLIEGIPHKVKNNRNSIYAYLRSVKEVPISKLYIELQRHNLLDVFKSYQTHFFRIKDQDAHNRRQADLYEQIQNIRSSKDEDRFKVKDIDSDEHKLAKILASSVEDTKLKLKESGYVFNDLDDFVMNQAHDVHKITKFVKGDETEYQRWKKYLTDRIDYIKTFSTDLPTDGKVEEVMRKMWNSLVERPLLIRTGTQVQVNEDIPAVLHKRRIYFKDALSAIEYSNEYGQQKNLPNLIMDGLKKNHHMAGLADTLGTSYNENIARIFQHFITLSKDQPGIIEDLHKELSLLMDSWNNLLEIEDLVENYQYASWGRLSRAWIAMSTLGQMIFSQSFDPFISGRALRRADIGTDSGVYRVAETYAKSLMSLLDTVKMRFKSHEDFRELAHKLGVASENLLGQYNARLIIPETYTEGKIGWLQKKFFELNLSSWWDSSMRTSVARIVAEDLATKTKHLYKDLSEDYQRNLSAHGIDEDFWNLMHQFRSELIDNKTTSYEMIFNKRFHSISDEFYEKYLELQGKKAKKGKKMPKGDILNARLSTIQKMDTYLYSIIQQSVVEPTPIIRARLTFGTQPGTILGEAIRLLTQLNYFTLAFFTRGVAPEFYHGKSHLGGSIAGILRFGGIMTAWAILAIQAKEIVNGRHPREIDGYLIMDAVRKSGFVDMVGVATLEGAISPFYQGWSRFAQSLISLDVFEAGKVVLDYIPYGNLVWTKVVWDNIFRFWALEVLYGAENLSRQTRRELFDRDPDEPLTWWTREDKPGGYMANHIRRMAQYNRAYWLNPNWHGFFENTPTGLIGEDVEGVREFYEKKKRRQGQWTRSLW